MTQANASWPIAIGEMADRIRQFDWPATSLGPLSGWSERLKLAIEMVLASPLVASVVCGPERILIYNDAAARLYGDRHPAALGRPLPDAFPEGWGTVAHAYERAFAGETVQVVSQPLDTRGEGAVSDVFDALLSPVREQDGHVAYVLMSGTEVGERNRAEQRFHDIAERYRSLFNSIDEGLAIVEMIYDDAGEIVDMIFRQVNAAYERQGGTFDVVGRSIREVLPGVEDVWLDRYKKVARTGQPIRVEDYQQDVDRWFDVYFSRVDTDGHFVAIVFNDISERKHAEATLRDSEARYQALLAASPMPSIVVAPNAPDFTIIDVNDVYVAATLSTRDALIGRKLFDVFLYDPTHPGLQGTGEVARSFARVLATRQTDVMPRVRQDMMTSNGEFEPHWWLGVNAPMFDADQNVIAIIHQATRVTEQYYTEEALRESKERFAQFAASSADVLWIRDAATLAMEYVSPAIEAIYGVRSEAILGDPKHWAVLIVPEDRDAALGQLEAARSGKAVIHEFRILRPSDGAFRWIRNTDFPLLDERGRVQRIGGIAEDVTETKQAAAHQGVLLHELQHRVRNILAMIRSMADQTGDSADDVEDYRDLLDGRLRALARVQVLLTQAANAGVDLATLIRAEVEAQAIHEGQCSLNGPDLSLSPKAAEVLTLAIHELSTNALKYGAFSHAAGRLAVTWRVFYPTDEPWLGLEWAESGAPAPLAPPQREGFGTLLIEQRVSYELRGRGQITVAPEGARCRLEFPLRRGDSILETDGVTLNMTIAGGSLDMTGEADLCGCKVLVVEDDYFLARDTGRAVRKAGGDVLGPVGQEEKALALIATEAPTCALVDINLGEGAQFSVASTLQDRGVPFAFVTGYDDVMIPARFDGVERIRKPTDFRQIVRLAARLCKA